MVIVWDENGRLKVGMHPDMDLESNCWTGPRQRCKETPMPSQQGARVADQKSGASRTIECSRNQARNHAQEWAEIGSQLMNARPKQKVRETPRDHWLLFSFSLSFAESQARLQRL